MIPFVRSALYNLGHLRRVPTVTCRAGPSALPLQLQCISALGKAHASMPVSLAFFTPGGNPATAGRDSTLRTSRCQTIASPPLPLPINSPPVFDADDATTGMPTGSMVGCATAVGSGSTPPAVGGPGISEGVQTQRAARPQLLRCIGVEVIPGLTAVVADRVVPSVEGAPERLVAGFQVIITTECYSSPPYSSPLLP